MITIKSSKGNWDVTFKYFDKATEFFDKRLNKVIEKYGEKGVKALQEATPVDTGKTADSWRYETRFEKGKIRIVFVNDNVVDGENVAILIRYGHGTKNGGYVAGRDFVSPAIAPIFDELANSAWKEIVSL